MDRLSNPLLALFSSLTADTPELIEQPPWRHLFAGKGVPGTFVLYQPLADRWLVHDAARAREPLLPHGTFDIANALVGLETGR
jgi:beta-lactamase class D